jgi:hypothetical protein
LQPLKPSVSGRSLTPYFLFRATATFAVVTDGVTVAVIGAQLLKALRSTPCDRLEALRSSSPSSVLNECNGSQ